MPTTTKSKVEGLDSRAKIGSASVSTWDFEGVEVAGSFLRRVEGLTESDLEILCLAMALVKGD